MRHSMKWIKLGFLILTVGFISACGQNSKRSSQSSYNDFVMQNNGQCLDTRNNVYVDPTKCQYSNNGLYGNMQQGYCNGYFMQGYNGNVIQCYSNGYQSNCSNQVLIEYYSRQQVRCL